MFSFKVDIKCNHITQEKGIQLFISPEGLKYIYIIYISVVEGTDKVVSSIPISILACI